MPSAHLLRSAVSAPVVGLVLALATWTLTPASVAPGDDLDIDYRAALEWAATHHVAFGPHFNFTYGPLGFLASPFVFYGAPAALSVAFITLLGAATGAVLYAGLRRSVPRPAAVVLAYVVMVLAPTGIAVEVMIALGLVWATWLASGRRGRGVDAAIVLAGSFTAFAAMVKVGLGPTLALTFVLALLLRRVATVRSLAAFAGGGIGAGLLIWSAMGCSLGDLPSWARSSAAYISGYQAMDLEGPGRLYFYWLAALGLIAVAALAGIRGARDEAPPGPPAAREAGGAGWRAPSGEAALRTIGWVAMVLVASAGLLREAFDRNDGRDVLLFATLPLLLVAACPPGWRPALRSQPTLLVAAGLCAVTAAGALSPTAARPVTAVHDWVSTAHLVLSPSRREATEEGVRTSLQASYDLPGPWVHALSGRPVADLTLGSPVAWIYPAWRWAPLPTLQEYTAYTPVLDGDDAAYLSGGGAPPWVLWTPSTIDGRNPVWDAPATNLAMRCDYVAVGTDSHGLSLLRRVPDRCGAARRITSIRVDLGHAVTVPRPPPGDALVASMQVSSSLLGSLASLSLKGATYSVRTDSGSYRYVSETGADPHLLSWPVDGAGVLAVPEVRTLTITSNDPVLSGPQVAITFSAVPVGSGPEAPAGS